MDNYYTIHVLERSKERLNLNAKNAERQIKLALERGKRAEDFKSSIERRFLESRAIHDSYAIAYNGSCYILDKETDAIITVYLLPAWWNKKKRYEGKERVRKAKAYYRLNDMECFA